jgi:tetratricopeptide (TPR) repeat protein
MLREATKLKNEGNDLLAAGKLTLARVKYEKTVRNLESLRGLDDDEHDAVRDVKRKTLLNLAAALQRLGEHAGAIKSLEKLLNEDEDDAKALWRRSVSLLATHEYAAARVDLNKCVESDPSTAEDVARQLRRVDEREESGVARERLVAERALG